MKITIRLSAKDDASAVLRLIDEMLTKVNGGVTYEPHKNGIDIKADPAIEALVDAVIVAPAVCGVIESATKKKGMLNSQGIGDPTGRVCQGKVGHWGRHLFRYPVIVEVAHAATPI